jgi:hypothetical protein
MDERASKLHGRLHKGSMGVSRDFKIETSTEGPPVPRLGLSRKEVDAVGRERPPPRVGGIEKGISGSWFAAKGLPPDGLEPMPLELMQVASGTCYASGTQLLQPVTTYRCLTPTSKYSGSCSVELTERDLLMMCRTALLLMKRPSIHIAVVKYGQVGLSCEVGPSPRQQMLKDGQSSARASRTSVKSTSIFRNILEWNFPNFRNIPIDVLEHSRTSGTFENRLRRCLRHDLRRYEASSCLRHRLRRSSPSKTVFHRLRRSSGNTLVRCGVLL